MNLKTNTSSANNSRNYAYKILIHWRQQYLVPSRTSAGRKSA